MNNIQIELEEISPYNIFQLQLLYELLQERTKEVNISNKKIPTFEEHKKFVQLNPYADWCFIVARNSINHIDVVGTIYLTKAPEHRSQHGNELGIFIYKKYQGYGYAKPAIREMMKKHGPSRYLANINPENQKSISLFTSMGFNLCQKTYELDYSPGNECGETFEI